MVKRKTEFSRMWLVDSTMMKNLNTTSSHSKVNNHVNFSLTKPSDEIQYKTIDRIPWREEQERSSSSKKPTDVVVLSWSIKSSTVVVSSSMPVM